MSKGFVPYSREVGESWIAKDKNACKLMNHFVTSARHTPTPTPQPWGLEFIIVEKGHYLSSWPEIAQKLAENIGWVRRHAQRLKRAGLLEWQGKAKSGTLFRVPSLCTNVNSPKGYKAKASEKKQEYDINTSDIRQIEPEFNNDSDALRCPNKEERIKKEEIPPIAPQGGPSRLRRFNSSYLEDEAYSISVAVEKLGNRGEEDAMHELSPFAWRVVQERGGWRSVCSLFADRAQIARGIVTVDPNLLPRGCHFLILAARAVWNRERAEGKELIQNAENEPSELPNHPWQCRAPPSTRNSIRMAKIAS